jgi:hypothetical protein
MAALLGVEEGANYACRGAVSPLTRTLIVAFLLF